MEDENIYHVCIVHWRNLRGASHNSRYSDVHERLHLFASIKAHPYRLTIKPEAK